MMAKAHEPEHSSYRPLTPEETARRKAAMEEGDQPKVKSVPAQSSEYGGPVESYTTRLEKAAAVPAPWTIDYDRDGHPDSVVGRSGRNLRQSAAVAAAANPTTGEAFVDYDRDGLPDGIAGRSGRNLRQSAAPAAANQLVGIYTRGGDGFTQDQIGYRERLRARVAAAAELTKAGESGTVYSGVPSHGSTGVPGGEPAIVLPRTIGVPPAATEPVGPTPLEQAIMAPRTAGTGFNNKGAQLTAKKPGDGDGGAGGGTPGPYGTIRRGSFGNVPVQGTQQADGSFSVAGAPAEEPPPEGKSKSVPVKPHEHAKPAEHAAKPHEPAKHPEHHDKK